MTEELKNKSGSRNTSVSLENEVFDWLDTQGEKYGINRSKLINDIIRERIRRRPSGLNHDIEWILDNKVNYHKLAFGTDCKFHYKLEDCPEYGDFSTAYSITLDDEPPLAYVLAAEDTRETLKDLFADSVMFYMEKVTPIILVIPYRMDPSHKIWELLSKHEGIIVTTPEDLVDHIEGIMSGLPEDWNHPRVPLDL